MIVQVIFDIICEILSGLIALLPPFPSFVTDLLFWVGEIGAFIGDGASKFYVIMPLDTFVAILNIWVLIVGVYLAFLFIKFLIRMFKS